jgi:Bacterial protein of unknown function (DUF885)
VENNLVRNLLIKLFVLLSAILFIPLSHAGTDWVAKSNIHAQVFLDAIAKYIPEQAGSLGVDGLDEEIFDLRPQLYERNMADLEQVVEEYERRLSHETGTKLRQDLAILLKSAKDTVHTTKLEREHMLPYHNLGQDIFQGIRSLIDPQIPKERYPAALVRLKKYTGQGKGYRPITELAMEHSRGRFDVEGLVGPYRGEVEQDLERSEKFISGIKELFEGTDLKGWKGPYKKLKRQINDYNQWVRNEILSRAREDFRLPAVMYRDALHNWGVDADPEELIHNATQGYMDIRNEMVALAPLVAKEKGYNTTDYRTVIRKLKEEQISGDELVDYYKKVLKDIEAFTVREKLISLPKRDAGIRIATAAETAAQPAPHLDIPRLIGNTGEHPEFVIPLLEKDEAGNWIATDDTYKAGTWTLTAHEARPGHELQFSSMLETGVSITRAIFAFNSANVEGWALYAEAIAKPYMPLEAQMISLQYRLTRAARMFLDPMLNLGRITPEEAKRLLMEDVLIGEKWAQNEIERYTYRMPGQATAYYYGYAHMQGLRTKTELALQGEFDQQAFHDFILEQGLLPPDILRKAVMEEFVPAHRD